MFRALNIDVTGTGATEPNDQNDQTDPIDQRDPSDPRDQREPKDQTEVEDRTGATGTGNAEIGSVETDTETVTVGTENVATETETQSVDVPALPDTDLPEHPDATTQTNRLPRIDTTETEIGNSVADMRTLRLDMVDDQIGNGTTESVGAQEGIEMTVVVDQSRMIVEDGIRLLESEA